MIVDCIAHLIATIGPIHALLKMNGQRKVGVPHVPLVWMPVCDSFNEAVSYVNIMLDGITFPKYKVV